MRDAVLLYEGRSVYMHTDFCGAEHTREAHPGWHSQGPLEDQSDRLHHEHKQMRVPPLGVLPVDVIC